MLRSIYYRVVKFFERDLNDIIKTFNKAHDDLVVYEQKARDEVQAIEAYIKALGEEADSKLQNAEEALHIRTNIKQNIL